MILRIFSCAFWPSVCLLWRNVSLGLLPNFDWVVCLGVFSCMSSLYILEIILCWIASFTNIFSHSKGYLFVLFMVSFAVQKLLSLIQFSSVAQSCPTLCDPMECSTPGLPVHHQLLEFTQTRVHWGGDAIQPSHPLSSPFPFTFNHSQHQGLFKWVSSSHQVAKVLKFQLQHQSFQWKCF